MIACQTEIERIVRAAVLAWLNVLNVKGRCRKSRLRQPTILASVMRSAAYQQSCGCVDHDTAVRRFLASSWRALDCKIATRSSSLTRARYSSRSAGDKAPSVDLSASESK